MSEENAVGWEKYRGKTVMVQLRTQPYIGVTGEQLEPVIQEDGFGTTPVVRGTVVDVWDDGNETMLELQTTDPNPKLPNNKVFILLNTKRDVGYLTTVEASRIAVAQ